MVSKLQPTGASLRPPDTHSCFSCFSMITICRDGTARSDPRWASRPRRASSRGGPGGRLLGPVHRDAGAGVAGEATRHRLLAHAARPGWRAVGRLRQRPSRGATEAWRAAGPSSPRADGQSLCVSGRGNLAGRLLGGGGRGVARERSDPMTTPKVGIASYEEMKARTMAVARGERRVKAKEPKVWFTSTESFAKVLSAGNRELLRVIAEKAPGSLDELARITGEAKSNLSRTLRTMEGCADTAGDGREFVLALDDEDLTKLVKARKEDRLYSTWKLLQDRFRQLVS